MKVLPRDLYSYLSDIIGLCFLMLKFVVMTHKKEGKVTSLVGLF